MGRADGRADTLATLREQLAATDRISDPIEEMLEIAAIVEEAVAPLGIHPVVVGGLAVAYWTAGSGKYLTSDIDVVMPHSPEVLETLAALGFEKEGRLWVLPNRKPFFEAPGSYLRPSREGFTVIELASGRSVRMQTAEEVLLLRLDEFVSTGHADVLQQCLWLRGSSAIDEQILLERAKQEHLDSALTAIDGLVDKIKTGLSVPPPWELHDLAKRLRSPSKQENG